MSDNNTAALPTAAFVGNYIIRGKFKCLTGLHIGGSKEKLEIGGVDSPVVRDPRTRFPYVPGSSLKGKLRSLLEYALGLVPASGDVSNKPDIVRLFGIGVDEREDADNDPEHKLYRIGPSRLIVRDCHPTEQTREWWKTLDTDLLYTEYKSENGINRITSAANPRFIERVAADSEFDFELIYTAYDLQSGDIKDDADTDLENLRMAILLLEHNFLGKSGSRGYGRVEFRFDDPVWLTQADYQGGKTDAEKAAARENMNKATQSVGEFDTLKRTGDIDWTIAALSNSPNL